MLRLREVLTDLGASVHGAAAELEFQSVSTDGRAPQPDALFVALRGPRFDGHDFLAQAAARGATAALVERPLPPESVPLVQIRVPDTLEALRRLAHAHARRTDARRVGVTGSNGKTTTKELLRAALSVGGPTLASEKSFNNHIGVPLTLLGIRPETAFAVVELGTNRPGEIAALAELTGPELAVVTNCSCAHVEQLGGLEGVVQEKGALLEALPEDGIAVLNADDESFEALAARARGSVIAFGVRRRAKYRASAVEVELTRSRFQLDGLRVELGLGGCHSVYNALAALAVAAELGLDRAEVSEALRTADTPPMRLQLTERGPLQILDDSYNANPGSVKAAFQTLSAARDGRRNVVVLGTMRELGEHAAQLHREAGELVGMLDGEALLVAVGEFAGDVRDGALGKDFAEERILTFDTTEEAARRLPTWLRPGDRVLVKGSRAMAMERIVEALAVAGAACAG